mmetsp:Transcript_29444/g.77429  ORF Transcript_29444/g.77429 Transcript_29444/m.77429 type:complete len:209 (-) Transcript_29444:145-771(-)
MRISAVLRVVAFLATTTAGACRAVPDRAHGQRVGGGGKREANADRAAYGRAGGSSERGGGCRRDGGGWRDNKAGYGVCVARATPVHLGQVVRTPQHDPDLPTRFQIRLLGHLRSRLIGPGRLAGGIGRDRRWNDVDEVRGRRGISRCVGGGRRRAVDAEVVGVARPNAGKERTEGVQRLRRKLIRQLLRPLNHPPLSGSWLRRTSASS